MIKILFRIESTQDRRNRTSQTRPVERLFPQGNYSRCPPKNLWLKIRRLCRHHKDRLFAPGALNGFLK